MIKKFKKKTTIIKCADQKLNRKITKNRLVADRSLSHGAEIFFLFFFIYFFINIILGPQTGHM